MRERSEQKQLDDDAALQIRFGAIVRIYRQRSGLSQEELAWRAGMHRTYLADVERGRRNISLVRIVHLVNALGVSMAEFFLNLQDYFQSPIEAPPLVPAKRSAKAHRSATPRGRNAKAARG